MPEPPPLITVHADITRNVWVTTFHGNQALIRTLGSDTLPTHFPLHLDGYVAREEVQRLHPHARVRLIDRDGTLFDPGMNMASPGRTQSPARTATPWYRVPGTPLTLTLHQEDTPPSLCLGLGFDDSAMYGGCDAHDAGLLADAIERRQPLTLHASASSRAQAQVRWAPDTLTVAAYGSAATRAFPDPRARAALCAVLRLIAKQLQHAEDTSTAASGRRSP